MSTHTLWRLKLGHVAFAGVSSRFSDSSFPTLSKQTLSFINVTSFHLALVGDLKSKAIFLFLHSFLHPHLLSLHRKREPSFSKNVLPFFSKFQLPRPWVRFAQYWQQSPSGSRPHFSSSFSHLSPCPPTPPPSKVFLPEVGET